MTLATCLLPSCYLPATLLLPACYLPVHVQSNYILFSTISGGMYFQEFCMLTEALSWVMFVAGIFVMCARIAASIYTPISASISISASIYTPARLTRASSHSCLPHTAR